MPYRSAEKLLAASDEELQHIGRSLPEIGDCVQHRWSLCWYNTETVATGDAEKQGLFVDREKLLSFAINLMIIKTASTLDDA
jgi:hypothetical protein